MSLRKKFLKIRDSMLEELKSKLVTKVEQIKYCFQKIIPQNGFELLEI